MKSASAFATEKFTLAEAPVVPRIVAVRFCVVAGQ